MFSIIKKYRKKLFLRLEELFINCDKRLPYKETKRLSQQSENRSLKSKSIAFRKLYYLNDFYCSLLRIYKKRNFISFYHYKIIKIIRKINTFRTFLVFIFCFKKYKIYVISKFKFSSKYLTFALDNKNLIPKITNYPLENIQIKSIRYIPNIKDRIHTIYHCLKFNMTNWYYVFQYKKLKEGLSKIDFDDKIIIVEEAGDIKQQMFLDFAQENSLKVLLTIRGILDTNCRHWYDFEIVTDNLISKKFLQKCNKNVRQVKRPFLMNFNKIDFAKRDYTGKIGYLPDLGDFFMNFHDKTIMDKFINQISKDRKLSFSISLHPQDKSKGLEGYNYYKSIFDSEYIKYREESEIEDYLNSIDILTGWSSTVFFQALISKVPVVIIDLFNDKPMENLVVYSEGFARYATDENEFVESIKYFYSISSEKKNAMYKKCLQNLNIDIHEDGLETILNELQ